MESFAGRVAVVTGAASGIGYGLAQALVEHGARVVLADIHLSEAQDAASQIRALGGDVMGTTVDVSDLASVQRLRATATEAFGKVDLLFNNAGVSVRRRGIHSTHADWQWVIGVNLWGVIHGVETFLPGMLSSGQQAHIVNTSSMNGIVPSAFSAMYSASKYGVNGLTETLRNELSQTNVGISLLCPAAVSTRIGESERSRPDHLRPSSPAPTHVPSTTFDLSPPKSPVEVAELTLEGIRRNQLYIFTDAKVQLLIEAHHQRMLADFAHL